MSAISSFCSSAISPTANHRQRENDDPVVDQLNERSQHDSGTNDLTTESEAYPNSKRKNLKVHSSHCPSQTYILMITNPL
jgi:hypothetical protein